MKIHKPLLVILFGLAAYYAVSSIMFGIVNFLKVDFIKYSLLVASINGFLIFIFSFLIGYLLGFGNKVHGLVFGSLLILAPLLIFMVTMLYWAYVLGAQSTGSVNIFFVTNFIIPLIIALISSILISILGSFLGSLINNKK